MSSIEKAIELATKFRKHGFLINELFDLARVQEASAIERGLKPFPIVVKDCFTLQDAPTTCGSKMLSKFRSPYTATVVKRLIDRGCVLGKANMDEFSMGTSSVLGHFGPVKSEILSEDDWIIPGGSSGGSAVAVKLGVASVALGSDTGGSSRNPAAFNGIFGLKPTFGVLSRNGLIPLVNNLDVPAIMARSADECWKYLDIMRGVDTCDPTSIELDEEELPSSLHGLRIGIPKEYHDEALTEDGWKSWNHAANIFNRLGAKTVPISLPLTRHSLDCYHVLSGADIASNMARYDGVAYGHRSELEVSTVDMYANSRSESLNSVVRKRIMAGNYFLMKQHRRNYIDRATKVRRLIADEILRSFKDVDVILTPTASGSAPSFSKFQQGNFVREDLDDYYTQPANLAGVPAISVPMKNATNGLPFGVQLIANRLRDHFLCFIAQRLFDASQVE